MILSVTPNTAIDYTLRVSEFSLGQTIRALESAWGMGGKAADAAWILGQWGVENLALGFAAGPNGHRMEEMLRERSCQTDFVWVDGETRLNCVICSGGKHSTFTSSTLTVTPEHIDTFYKKYNVALENASCLVVGGTAPQGVPSDFFHRVIKLARLKDIPVIFDSSGLYLQKGLEAHPTVIKPNLSELVGLSSGGISMKDLGQTLVERNQAAYALARNVQARYGTSLVVTLGDEGGIALIGNTHYWIPSIPVDVISAAGAGDAVLAGLAVSYARGLPLENGLRLGFAFAASVLRSLATADYNPNDVEKFLPLIKLLPITGDDIFPMMSGGLKQSEARHTL